MVCAIFLTVGLLVGHHPMLLTGMARIQGDPGDTRLINYVLEHGYRWLMHMPGHQAFWDPAFFYPVKNSLAYSDTLLGVLPFYAIWRLAGLLPDTAFQFWWLTISLLNYLAFYFFIRQLFGLSPLASALGAFLFAFGGPRISQVGHQQLFANFYIVIAIYALARVFQSAQASTSYKRPGYFCIPVFFGCVTAQIYAGFYFGWFFLFALGIAFIWAIFMPGYRTPLLSVLRNHTLSITASLVLTILALMPMIVHYAEAAGVIGYPNASDVSLMTPRLYSWIYSGPFSWLYTWTARIEPFRSLYMDQEHRLGLGFVTSIVALYGLYHQRNQALVRLLILVSLTIFLCVTMFPPGLSLWPLISEIVPGAKAIRAVSRIGILLLIPASLGVAFFVGRVQGRGMSWAMVMIIMLCILEQGRTDPSFLKYPIRSHVEAIAEEVNPACEAFLYAPHRASPAAKDPWIVWNIKNNIDAMWAQMETGIPTLNGYSGYSPPGWPFLEINTQTEAEQLRLRRRLTQWSSVWNLDPNKVCWIEKPADERWSRDTLLSYFRTKYQFIELTASRFEESRNPHIREWWARLRKYWRNF